MQNLQALRVPRMELLSHILAIDLMDDYIELVDIGKDTHLKLSAPGATQAHQSNISGDRDVILHEKLVVFLFCL